MMDAMDAMDAMDEKWPFMPKRELQSSEEPLCLVHAWQRAWWLYSSHKLRQAADVACKVWLAQNQQMT